jgi:hypothetical protein
MKNLKYLSFVSRKHRERKVAFPTPTAASERKENISSSNANSLQISTCCSKLLDPNSATSFAAAFQITELLYQCADVK